MVRASLTKTCFGSRRCGYCEDSVADEVEHIKPKDLYPELAFVWKNYLYACGPCNGPKNNQFAVLSHRSGTLVEVSRRHGQPIVPPERGDPVLIDPRTENPLDYLQLDLLGTFLFLPAGTVGSREFCRASYTIRVLRLNDRDYLLAARREAFLSYRARLVEYVAKKESGISGTKLNRLVTALRSMGHPTVWHEIKRQHSLIPELNALFDKAPEAVHW